MKNLVARRNELMREFEKYSDFVRGSINSVCAKCNRARCICDKKTSRRAYLSSDNMFFLSGILVFALHIPTAKYFAF